MTPIPTTDVFIVGGGPAGLCAGLLLARSGQVLRRRASGDTAAGPADSRSTCTAPGGRARCRPSTTSNCATPVFGRRTPSSRTAVPERQRFVLNPRHPGRHESVAGRHSHGGIPCVACRVQRRRRTRKRTALPGIRNQVSQTLRAQTAVMALSAAARIQNIADRDIHAAMWRRENPWATDRRHGRGGGA